MADLRHSTDGPSPRSSDGFDESLLPDINRIFVSNKDIDAFAAALNAPDPTIPENDPTSPNGNGFMSPPYRHSRRSSIARMTGSEGAKHNASQSSLFITAQNDWAPVNTRVKGLKRKKGKAGVSKAPTRSIDETREGYLYTILKWPLLAVVGIWVFGLGASYLLTRFYIWMYENFINWRGKREQLRKRLQDTTNYADWVKEAREMDRWAGNEEWKTEDTYAYYDSKTVRRVLAQMKRARRKAEVEEAVPNASQNAGGGGGGGGIRGIEELRNLIEACVKNNFVGVENPRLYSQTYYGTKDLVQEFIDEVEKGVGLLTTTKQLDANDKRSLFKRMHTNYGRTALCLSGGASFAYYHFGVIKALLDADILPEVITGTSGGALVAALVATRTNEELKALLVPALACKINACSESFTTWVPRWWKTGARFDSVEWARRCSWFTRGSMTFREAYERTGRILNVSCVPADPHSPTILTNYLTSPDCVIWSAVLASAAVPGILNPVVLMMKQKDGSLAPYSFGHKWKDGSLRTDIPLKALNLHFNVNFSIVSQVNPHINLFFFSSRGSVGQPVTHRRGRGWRGGFVGSATEQYLKLDLNKWLKVLRHLELLPRFLGQDWSEIWLQQFSGTITIWPRSRVSDFWRILTDPDAARLADMLHTGQQSAFPKLQFLANRLKVERKIERGRRETRNGNARRGSIESIWSEDEVQGLLRGEGGATDEDTEGVVSDEESALFEAVADGFGDTGIGSGYEDEEDLIEGQLRSEAAKKRE